ncbi:putative polysaccharide biosynthesis protein [Lipomyces tetrasporus]|uniref:Protein PBDC1 homolog n=1 Tax=Lipomyces tetrasporus TaxID=54092 RepID=A0AAD7QQ02_9ASCO|nr:putative polysaccharide biosynthesis protein [Lipomyces tetrasporus]KAJ8098841.1 putative polysaccharide biosynthesis protein [Lipomyces tetrasporus]
MSAPKTFDAENADNLEDIEKQFAVKAVMQAQTYWNLLEKVKGSTLRLTRLDDEIYEHFIKDFPEYDSADAVAEINEDDMKSPKGKDRWRKFMNTYEKTVHDFNFGTLLRTGSKDEYEEKTTIFVPRMQFLAVEIARNKHGLNDWIYGQEHK